MIQIVSLLIGYFAESNTHRHSHMHLLTVTGKYTKCFFYEYTIPFTDFLFYTLMKEIAPILSTNIFIFSEQDLFFNASKNYTGFLLIARLRMMNNHKI